MTRAASLLSFILLAGMCQAQDTTGTVTTSRLHISVQGSADHAYRTLLQHERNVFTDMIMDTRDRSEVPRIGYTGSVMMGYGIGRLFGVEAGVGYALRGWEWDLSTLSFGDAIDPRRGFVYNTDDVLPRIRYEFRSVHVPVRATITLGKGRLRSISAAGLAADVLLSARSVTHVGNDRHTTDLEGFNTFDLAAIVSTGLAYAPCASGTIRIEPTLRHGLIDIRADDPIGARLWSVGLMLGYVHRL